MLSYFGEQQNHIFGNVAVLIYVFDLSQCVDNKIPTVAFSNIHFLFQDDIREYRNALELVNNLSGNAMIFCLLHKSDLIVGPDKETVNIL